MSVKAHDLRAPAESYAAVHSVKNLEFGGAYGVLFLIIWSHYILFYFWYITSSDNTIFMYCLQKADGGLIMPLSVESLLEHLSAFGELFLAKGIPSTLTWVAYFSFFVVQLLLAAIMPGMVMYGVPTDGGKRLVYLCNGYLCYYFCIGAIFLAHYTGYFPITHLADNYGEYLVASMIIANVTSVFWYFYGIIVTPNQTRTGIAVYDFFMGTVLYPRIGIVDIKMVSECRWSWLTLFILTLSCAAKQYEQLGYVSREMGVMVLAHWLYSNATVKGEHCIPCTWDMFHERYGWMLNFWNITGVPFLYCFQSFYILRNQDSISVNNPIWFVAGIYVLLVVGYYIFDTANSQKACWKMPGLKRNTFPQLAWAQLKDPIRCIRTPKGDLMVDGWYAFARKMQYTGDIMMATSWGLSCGFGSFLPYFYVFFFILMITHRQWRDEIRCKEKYGVHWEVYTKLVPNVFIPGWPFVHWMLTGEMPAVGKEITLALRAEEIVANRQPEPSKKTK